VHSGQNVDLRHGIYCPSGDELVLHNIGCMDDEVVYDIVTETPGK